MLTQNLISSNKESCYSKTGQHTPFCNGTFLKGEGVVDEEYTLERTLIKTRVFLVLLC